MLKAAMDWFQVVCIIFAVVVIVRTQLTGGG